MPNLNDVAKKDGKMKASNPSNSQAESFESPLFELDLTEEGISSPHD
jgi:hypothetical protein